MAKLSEETQAIIDRLKAEGELSRNRGTHSVRSVKIQLQKFEKVFDSINANTIEQTKMMQRQLGIAQEAVEFQKNQEQFDELKRDAEVIQEERIEASGGRDDTKINAFGDKVAKAFSLKNLALGAAGLFVGYNLLKGFVDEKTDGGFTRFIDSFKQIDWVGFKDTFNGMIASLTKFEEWLDNLPMLLLGGGLVGNAARNLGMGMMSGRNAGPPGTGPTRGRAGLGGIRGIILTAVTGLAIAYGNKVEEYLVEQAGVDPDVANFTVDAGQAILGGATLAMMFGLGPTGIIIGAAVGLAYVVGKSIYNWMEERRINAAAEMAQRMAVLDEIFDIDSTNPSELKGVVDDIAAGAGVEMTPAQALAKAVQEGAITQEQVIEAAGAGESGRVVLKEAVTAGVVAALRDRNWATKADLEAKLETLITNQGTVTDNELLTTVLEDIRGKMSSGDNTLASNAQGSLQQFLKVYGISGTDDEMFSQLTPQEQNFFRALSEIPMNSFSRGSGGFLNFGRGTLSMLHGNEAVVTESSPEGQFLKMFETVVKNKSVGGMAEGTGTVVVNAPQNNPVTVNNVQGAQTQNSLAVVGGGGSGNGGMPSFLPYFAK